MLIQRLHPEFIKHEYGVEMRRVYPHPQTETPTPFGSAWCIVEPRSASAPHHHFEAETFYITEGQGVMRIEDEMQPVSAGDCIYIPADKTHELINDNDQRLVYISVWWEMNQEPKEQEAGK